MYTHTHTHTHTHTDSPQVVKFEISQDGKPVTALYSDNSFTLECEVYGYPAVNLSITGPEVFKQSEYEPRHERRWYSMKKTFNILNATEDFNGTYQCKGLIYLTQGGETAAEASDDGLEQPLVVYSECSNPWLSTVSAATLGCLQ